MGGKKEHDTVGALHGYGLLFREPLRAPIREYLAALLCGTQFAAIERPQQQHYYASSGVCCLSGACLLTLSVLTQRLSVGALGSRAAWKSHTLMALQDKGHKA